MFKLLLKKMNEEYDSSLPIINKPDFKNQRFCNECKTNPVPENLLQCIWCYSYSVPLPSCFHCEICTKERNFLKETNGRFKLLGYERVLGDNAEIWECLECNYCIPIQVLMMSTARNILHAKVREIHIKRQCFFLKNKIVTL